MHNRRVLTWHEALVILAAAVCLSVAQVLVELPYVALQSLLYSGITYLLVGFELAAAKFFWYLLFTFLTLTFFTYYGEGTRTTYSLWIAAAVTVIIAHIKLHFSSTWRFCVPATCWVSCGQHRLSWVKQNTTC